VRPHVVHWLEQMVPPAVAQALAPSWFTCVGLAGLVAMIWMLVIARQHRIDRGAIATMALWCYVAAVAAGIAMPMLIDAIQQRVTTGDVALRWSGMTSFWGYLAGLCAVAIVCKDHGLPLARLGDLATAPLGLALAIARLGCFSAGCDYGKVTSLPWAVRFPSGSPAWWDHVNAGLISRDRAESLPVHPTELYESLLGLVIMAVGLVCVRRGWRQGRVFLAGAATYAIGRIGIETVRGDAGRGVYAGLSSGQIFSLIVLAAIAAGLLVRRRRVARAAVAAAAVALAIVGAEARADAQAAPPATEPAPAPAPVATVAAEPAPMVDQALRIGVLVGYATPLNRRSDQVPPMEGVSLSIGGNRGPFGGWIDLDSYGNVDASHGTLLFSGSFTGEPSRGFRIGARTGLGATLVNFRDPAFRDVLGTTMRAEALAEYSLSEQWQIWARPISFDLLVARDLGGPIFTWQVRVGIAYRFARHAHRPPPPPPPPPAAPPPAAPPPPPPAPASAPVNPYPTGAP